ncbi:recombination factor protein RarA [Micrococcus luteus SK58]|uniref:replication-associated recombination protein A n=1 Tax=Micrococcus luteus TaxID=1270 RepID=UPI0001C4FEDD|nr:replication-associated recombination protein A [Micrococcus luteus]EFD50381.1 recombination factor protein RarA [Micrococcus luteus SK58]MCV7734387.1 replication-associated recombination protein A [Micrococcus luteus]TKD55756.1 replication-associated recombination protein A [Micrococcus luteus]
MDDLFSAAHTGADDDGPAGTVAAPHPGAPLAVRMRPRTLDDVLGQRHLMRPGSPLRKLAEPDPDSAAGPSSVILYGPPGIGKTTLAHVIARAPGRTFTELSAITAGVKDVRQVMEQAQRERDLYGRTTVLFLDEIHRFSKAQQDALLPGVENRWVVLVAATTENPSFSVIAPLLSRSLLLTLRPLTDDDIVGLLDRAVTQERGLNGAVVLEDDARDYLVRMAGGDARRALTVLEAAAGVALDKAREAGRAAEGAVAVTEEDAAQAMDHHVQRYDKDGDQHYDVISAFIKSIRGSDVDASMHYLARMLEAGEDPRFIARRLIISASEDVGMADPTALQTAVAAAQAVQLIGMPEGRIILAQAVTHLATAPKSNASYTAVNEAIADVRAGHTGAVPAHLRDAHYPGAAALGHGQGYVYSHDEPHAVARQQYAPDPLVGKDYYRPKAIGHEKRLAEQVAALRRIIRGE